MTIPPHFTLDYSIKDFFFDRLVLQERLDRAEVRELSKIGAFLQRRARSSLRRRKRSSAPGAPPSIHSRDSVATLKNILFGYQPRPHNVIVGPVGLNQVNKLSRGGTQTIPALMEFGGVLLIHEEQYKSDKEHKWFRRDFRRRPRPWKRYRTRLARYAARPFMGPALDAEIRAGTIRDVWIGSLERAA